MVVASRLQANGHRALQGMQLGHQPVVLGTSIGHHHPAPPPATRHLDQHIVPEFGNIDGDQDGGWGSRLGLGHG